MALLVQAIAIDSVLCAVLLFLITGSRIFLKQLITVVNILPNKNIYIFCHNAVRLIEAHILSTEL